MTRTRHWIIPIVLGLAVATASAEPEEDPTAKLRTQLRGSLLQLRNLQSEHATLQAAHSESEARVKELETRLASSEKRQSDLQAQVQSLQNSGKETAERHRREIAERDAAIQKFQQAIQQWQAASQQASQTAQAKEQERARLAIEAILLRREIAARETQNIALYRIGLEILERYENHALGKAILAKEPFVGTTRVKIENLVQSYKDAILKQRPQPGSAQP